MYIYCKFVFTSCHHEFSIYWQAVQVIVQSREGGKIRTRSNPNSTDWVSITCDVLNCG